MDRKKLGKHNIGKYSEMLVCTALVGDGIEVALPFGNQQHWDILAKEPDGVWQSIQVKTIGRITGHTIPPLHVSHGLKDNPYMAAEVDIIIAVHPESGTMWKIPPAVFSGNNVLALSDDMLWKGWVDRSAPQVGTKLLLPGKGQRKLPNMYSVHSGQAAKRSAIYEGLPKERPEWVSESSWQMALDWCRGEGYTIIGQRYDVNPSAVRERVMRVLYRLSLVDQKPYNMRRESRRSTPTRETLVLALAAAGHP